MSKLWLHTKSAHYWIGFKWSGDTVAWLPGIGWGRVMTRCSTGECDRSSDRIGSGSTPDSASSCPTCGTELEEREKMFHWRGTFLPGHVCVPCNALYQIDNNFTNHVRDHQ